jgi:hypothetical protein
LLLVQSLIQVGMMPLQVDQKGPYGSHKHEDSPQVRHIRKDVDGIQALF